MLAFADLAGGAQAAPGLAQSIGRSQERSSALRVLTAAVRAVLACTRAPSKIRRASRAGHQYRATRAAHRPGRSGRPAGVSGVGLAPRPLVGPGRRSASTTACPLACSILANPRPCRAMLETCG
jgi:hypothetical protein